MRDGMSKTVFIPLTDELVYERPEQILGRVVPFTQTARVPADGPPRDEAAVLLSEQPPVQRWLGYPKELK